MATICLGLNVLMSNGPSDINLKVQWKLKISIQELFIWECGKWWPFWLHLNVIMWLGCMMSWWNKAVPWWLQTMQLYKTLRSCYAHIPLVKCDINKSDNGLTDYPQLDPMVLTPVRYEPEYNNFLLKNENWNITWKMCAGLFPYQCVKNINIIIVSCWGIWYAICNNFSLL